MNNPVANYSRMPATLAERIVQWLRWPLTALAMLAALYLSFMIYAAGQQVWAVGALALFSAGFYIYLSQTGLAYRYLFPGIAGMLLFIAFPLIYTAQIGFTNYSSAHLLSQQRVRSYLLDQHQAVQAQVQPFSLHAGNGCFAGFADGAVKFLSAKTNVQVIRQLCDPADGEQPLGF